MFDIILESLCALLTGIIFLLLLLKHKEINSKEFIGKVYLTYGFAFLFIGMLIDITDNFPSLNKYVIIGNTPFQAFMIIKR